MSRHAGGASTRRANARRHIQNNINVGDKRAKERLLQSGGYQTPSEPQMCFRHYYLHRCSRRAEIEIVIDTANLQVARTRFYLNTYALRGRKYGETPRYTLNLNWDIVKTLTPTNCSTAFNSFFLQKIVFVALSFLLYLGMCVCGTCVHISTNEYFFIYIYTNMR